MRFKKLLYLLLLRYNIIKFWYFLIYVFNIGNKIFIKFKSSEYKETFFNKIFIS